MDTKTAITLARKHLGGEMESSALLCLSDAIRLYDDGDYKGASRRALKSLAYSVGVFHHDYAKVEWFCEGDA